jgi:hypothetical protein
VKIFLSLSYLNIYSGSMDIDKLVKECEKYGVSVEKPNGEPYSLVTIEKKLKVAKKKQLGGAKGANKGTAEVAVEELSQLVPVAHKVKSTSSKKDINQYPLLHEALVRAYLEKHGITKPTGETTVPVSIIMAVYGNHAELGKSGLSDILPDVVDDEELKKYWESQGVIQLTPQTQIPIKFVRI